MRCVVWIFFCQFFFFFTFSSSKLRTAKFIVQILSKRELNEGQATSKFEGSEVLEITAFL